MSGTQPNSQRKRPMLTITMSPEAVERLDEIARRTEQSRSAALESLVLAAEMPRAKKS